MLDTWHSRAKYAWNERAESWNAHSEELWERGNRRDILPVFLKHVRTPQCSILDIGCGDGYAAAKLASLGYQVTGVDISEEMILRASEQRATRGLVFQEGDITNLPFSNGSFAAVLAVNCIEWTEHPLHALEEIQRVLQPGGILGLAVLGPTAPPRIASYQRLYGESTYCNTMMPWECLQLCLENGWVCLEEAYHYPEGVSNENITHWPKELQQAVSCQCIYVFQQTENQFT